jgi:4-amino-4-deoxy-L-arabinose transferase-like glycosyltransferase
MQVDVLRFERVDGGWIFRAVEAGRAEEVVETHRRQFRRRRALWLAVWGLLLAIVTAYGVLVATEWLLTAAVDLVIVALAVIADRGRTNPTPEVVARDIQLERAKESYELAEMPAD